jgi:SpoVK/Ycf46/Vps4 family AAA+-type ATPase
LKLHTGKSFGLPFDELLIFSTNLDPKDIMDPALLRRLPYKIKLASPSAEEFRALFLHHAQASHLSGAEDVIDYAIELLTVRTEFGLANFQPKFICEQVAEVCASFYLQRHLTRDLVRDSLANLYVEIADIM